MLTSEMSCLKEELQNTKHLHLESNELAANTKVSKLLQQAAFCVWVKMMCLDITQ